VVCCSVLQCVAVHYSMLQYDAGTHGIWILEKHAVLKIQKFQRITDVTGTNRWVCINYYSKMSKFSYPVQSFLRNLVVCSWFFTTSKYCWKFCFKMVFWQESLNSILKTPFFLDKTTEHELICYPPSQEYNHFLYSKTLAKRGRRLVQRKGDQKIRFKTNLLPSLARVD